MTQVPRPAPAAPPGTGERVAAGLLVVAAFLWGSTFLVVKDATEDAGPVPFLAARFAVGALCLLPIAARRPATPKEIRHGVAAGTFFLLGFVFQTIGLQYTTSSSSAFITYLMVVFVPIIDALVLRRRPAWTTIVGIVVALFGLALLSGGVSGLGKGELLTMGCAVCFAVHLVILDRTIAQHDAFRLVFWQVLTVSAGCAVPGLFSGGYGFGAAAWRAVVFTGVGATAIAVVCMATAQRVLPPARTALLLLLEPVFAALLGYVVGERLGLDGAAGAALILLAVTFTELAPSWFGPQQPAGAGRPSGDRGVPFD